MRHQRLWLGKRATPSTRPPLGGDQHSSEPGDRLWFCRLRRPWVTKWVKFLLNGHADIMPPPEGVLWMLNVNGTSTRWSQEEGR